VRDWWRERLGVGAGCPPEDLCLGLAERFLASVSYDDGSATAAFQGRGALYVANHQVGIESLVFSLIASTLGDTVTLALAKAEHRQSWLGRFYAETFTYPGLADPGLLVFARRQDRTGLARAFERLGAELQSGKSVLVHVEGTRALAARRPVRELSLALLDTAIAAGAPVVPIRFIGGLPVEPLAVRLEFPIGYARQDCVIGRPIEADQLAALPSAARKRLVIDAINALGPPLEHEQPAAPDLDFAARVAAWQGATGATHTDAVMFQILRERPAPSHAIEALLAGAERGRLELDQSAESQWLRTLARRLFGPHGPEVA
jgi:1-acyl-sn-glycerol-3-phosphate acyltransferase